MKRIAERIIHLRNPDFQFDKELDTRALVQFLGIQVISLIRASRLLIYLRDPKFMMMATGVRFFNLHKISWGKFVKLGEHVYISALGKKGITIGNSVNIGAFSRIIVSTSLNDVGSHITIGNNVGIGEYTYLGGAGGLIIEADCIIGQYFSCHPENHEFQNNDKPIRQQGVSRKGIIVHSNCWIGAKVTILDGVTIGEGSVIAAGAVVTRSMPAHSVIAGVPAKALRNRLEVQVLNQSNK